MNAATKTVLKLAAEIQLPLEAVTETFAFIARKGAGKTYAASKMAEEMLGAGEQIIVLDLIGCWWGLRVLADGRPGFNVVVFGGLHGDLPITAEAGRLTAQVIVERRISAVIDVSMMRKGERKRFAADFAEELFELKKRNKTPVHLFVEEAQSFIPQMVRPDDARMLGAFEDIVRQGRNFGIGATLISQRPQSVNKEVLSQVECMFVLQLPDPHARKALRIWIVDQGIDVGDLIDTLPGLQKGEAWCWSPGWLRLTKRVHIAAKLTADTSKTPERGDAAAKVESKPLAPAELEKLRDAFKATIDQAEKDDPKALRKKIAELERQLVAKPIAAPAPKVEAKTVEKPVLKDGQLNRIEGIVAKLFQLQTAIGAESQPIVAALNAMKAASAQPQPRPPAAPRLLATTRPIVVSAAEGEAKLGRCELAILGALAVRRPNGLTRDQVALGSGYSGASGGFANALGKLRSLGLITTSGDRTTLTEAAESHVAGVTPPSSPGEVLAMWLSHSSIGKCERALLDVLVAHYPNAVSRDQLAEESGYSASSGGFANSLGRLRTLALAVNEGGGIRAADEIGGQG